MQTNRRTMAAAARHCGSAQFAGADGKKRVQVNAGQLADAQPFDPADCAAPLPRSICGPDAVRPPTPDRDIYHSRDARLHLAGDRFGRMALSSYTSAAQVP